MLVSDKSSQTLSMLPQLAMKPCIVLLDKILKFRAPLFKFSFHEEEKRNMTFTINNLLFSTI